MLVFGQMFTPALKELSHVILSRFLDDPNYGLSVAKA